MRSPVLRFTRPGELIVIRVEAHYGQRQFTAHLKRFPPDCVLLVVSPEEICHVAQRSRNSGGERISDHVQQHSV
eukprot:3135850-Prymnesium_polylepis.1